MFQRSSLRYSTLLLAAPCMLACTQANTPAPRPDVVLVVVDTLRNDRLSCYGYPRETSPVLDALADEGVLFEDVTAQWPWTLPSMVSLFQGQYLTDYRDSLHPAAVTIPEAFQQAGYRTLGVVGNCLVDEGQGFARGFDEFRIVDCWEDEEQKIKSRRDIELLGEMLKGPAHAALAAGPPGERAPVFVYIHAFDPHDPYMEHDGLNDALPLDGAPEVAPAGWWMSQLSDVGGWEDLPPKGRKNWRNSLQRMREMRARYDQEVRFFDQGLGVILDDLDQHGLSSNAVFALVADHGEGLWEHLSNEAPDVMKTYAPHRFFYKSHGGNGYQTASATPFVMWGAGVPRGRRVSLAVENVDLFPTLLELADIAPPPGLHGRSLVGAWNDEAPEWRTHVFSFGSHTIAVRDVRSDLKLVLPAGKSLLNGRGVELYDLGDDPGERTNLAGGLAGEVQDLVRAYEAWLLAYPTESTMKGKFEDLKTEQERILAEKLRALGYTEVDTGIPGLGEGADGK